MTASSDEGSRRATVRRAAWGIGDQALSSLTNFGLAIAVAHQVGIAEFGAFSIAFAVYLVALTVSRAVSTDPLSIRYSGASVEVWRTGTRSATGTALAFGTACGLISVVIGALVGGDVGGALVALGIGLPSLLVQDAWRYAFFAAARGASAFLNDLAWTVVLAAAFTVLFVTGVRAVPVLILAWAVGGLAGAIVGCVQARVVPAPGRSLAWWREHRGIAPRLAVEALILSVAQPLSLSIIGAMAGLAVVGTIRAGHVLMNAIHIASYGIQMFGVPEGIRVLKRSTGHLVRLCAVLAGGLMAIAAAWGTFLILLPDPIGEAFMEANWESAQSVLLPTTVLAIASGAQGGALIGLRALAATHRSLSARIVSSFALSVGAIAGSLAGGAVAGAWGMAIGLSLGSAFWVWQFWRAVADHVRSPAGQEERSRSVILEAASAEDLA